ncbi:FUSC family protein [Polyangium aurulentum]|uniref:FUSC family protein n=1 Tax=Polyangium aurulentum TaxID=2567896 RepID=UPI0010ADDD1F|nr:FUSC family protein [Polyangium aurulentum]UQA54834.1 FUSC family protein [Polyangium aurulentum]
MRRDLLERATLPQVRRAQASARRTNGRAWARSASTARRGARMLGGMLDSAYLRDALVSSDPDLARLRQAGRATLAAMAATAVLDRIAHAIGQPTSVGLVGIAMAMMGSVVVNDPAPRDQRITTALVPVTASLSLVAGALVSSIPWLQAAVLFGIVFVAVLVRRFGPRGTALGMILFMSYFFSIFFHATLAQVPILIAGVFIASALAYLVRFRLLREQPQESVRRHVDALRRTIAMALFRLAPVARDGRITERRLHAMRRVLGDLNELSLAIEEQCERIGPSSLLPGATASELRARVFELELALEGLASAVQHLAPLEAMAPPVRAAVADALLAARAAVRTGDANTEERAAKALEAMSVHACAVHAAHPLARLRGQLEDLLGAARWTFHPSPRAQRAEAPPPPAPPLPRPEPLRGPGAPPRPREWPLRLPVQATLAVVLALIAGRAASGPRAYWAVIAAFTVFTRATTLEATIVRAWHRVIGTIAGVIVGLFVAHAVQGHLYVELALVFACMFSAWYTLQISLAWMVASMTTLVAVLYSLLGRFSPELLYLRVVETFIGAGIGACVGTFVFPAHTRDTVRTLMADALCMLGDYIDQSIVQRASSRPGLLDAARGLDRKLREVRGEVRGIAGGLPLRPSRDIARIYQAFSAVFFYARPLVAAEWLSSAETDEGRLCATGRRLAANARAIAGELEGQSTGDVAPAGPYIETVRRALTPAEAERRGAGSPSAILYWLEHLDDALLVLDRVVRETGLAPAVREGTAPAEPRSSESDA